MYSRMSRLIVGICSVLMLGACSKANFSAASNSSQSSKVASNGQNGSMGINDPSVAPPKVSQPPTVSTPSDILMRNPACPTDSSFVNPMPAPSASAPDVFLVQQQPGSSFYAAEAGNVNLVQLDFQKDPGNLRIDNANHLGSIIQTQNWANICVGAQSFGGYNLLVQNRANVMTLINRSSSMGSPIQVTQDESRELQLFNIAVTQVIQQQAGSLLISYSGAVGGVIQNMGSILVMNPQQPLDSVLQNQGTIKIVNGDLGSVTQQEASGVIDISGGVIHNVDAQSSGTIILRNGAKILNNQSSSVRVENM